MYRDTKCKHQDKYKVLEQVFHLNRSKAAQGESEPMYLVWLSCGIVSAKLSYENCYHSVIVFAFT